MATKNQLIISSIFNGGNLLALIYYIYEIMITYSDLDQITRLSYYLNSIFTTICFLCDLFEYFLQENKDNIEAQMNYVLITDDEKSNGLPVIIQHLNDWNRNKFGVICNTFCYFVSIGFWLLFFLGNDIMLISKSIKNLFNCIYHHCIIQIIITIDIYTFKRRIHNFSFFYFYIIYSLFILYCIMLFIEKYYFEINAYYFMINISNSFLLVCFIIGSFVLFISYLFYIYLIELFNKNDKEQTQNIINSKN